jgi:hypothetical protein
MKRLLIATLLLVASMVGLWAQEATVLVNLKYRNLIVETKVLTDGKFEKTTKDLGVSAADQQILDLMVFKLNEAGVPATADGSVSNYRYKLLLHPVLMGIDSHAYGSVSVEIYTPNDVLIKRDLQKIRQLIGSEYTDKIANDAVKFFRNSTKL